VPLNLDGTRLADALVVFIELAVIWLVVYAVFRFLRGTRGAGVIKGFFLLTVAMALLVRVLGDATDSFQRLRFLFDRAFNLLAILLIVVFQPEIRAAFSRIGRTNLFKRPRAQIAGLAADIAEAAEFLSKNRFGALIVIERRIGIGDLLSGGVELDAKPSASLLQSVFWPNSPLHDLALVIRGGRVWGAGVQLPLAESDDLPAELGARHRAAIGVTEESDCVVVVVSEETGSIRIAEGGTLSSPIPRDDLGEELERRLKQTPAIVDDVVAGARAAIRTRETDQGPSTNGDHGGAR
jgi:diadenylate cyclase